MRARIVDVADERWDENAGFIANARQDVPRPIAEIRRLRGLLEAKEATNGARPVNGRAP